MKTADGVNAKRHKRIPEYLEADEVNAIIRAEPSPRAKLLLQQWRAGLRVSESLAIGVLDTSLDKGIPTISLRLEKTRSRESYRNTPSCARHL